MRALIIVAVTAAAAFLLAACASAIKNISPSPSADVVAVVRISPAEARQRLYSEQGIIVLDVRTAEEYAGGHIKGSVLLPVDNIAAEAATKLTDKESVIFVYCRSGRRSAIAAAALVKMGYAKVFDLGGIIDWPYEVVKD